MPAEFDQGFFVREPAWHGLGVILDDYPGREEAMRLAGHAWDIVELPVGVLVTNYQKAEGWKAHTRSDTGALLHISRETYQRIPNNVPYEFAELLLDQGFRYETGITLRGGALCALTLKLDEPITITGDNSVTLPYLGLAWAHDGSASFSGNSTSVRRVCANTVRASEAEGARLGTSFSIRHTKNWRARVEDARKAIKGVREDISSYRDVMEAYAAIPVTSWQRDLFCQAVVLDQRLSSVSKFKSEAAAGNYTARVQENVEMARKTIMAAFNSRTMPEDHRLTAYGLHLAGVEYLDHLRGFRSTDSHVGRTLLRHEPAKARLASLIREVVAA